MDIKVNQTAAMMPAEGTAPVENADNGFKFALTSAIEDVDLQKQLEMMLKDITKQGELIARHMDIRDMKKYRGQIKDFLNEIVNRSHKFSRKKKTISKFSVRSVKLRAFYWISLLNIEV